MALTQPQYETLPDEYFWMDCPCCELKIIPFTIGRVAQCPVCEYAWYSTCILSDVDEKPELRAFHIAVLRDIRSEIATIPIIGDG